MKSPPHIHTLLKSNVPGNLIIQSWERLAQIIKQKPSSELLGTMQNYDLVKHWVSVVCGKFEGQNEKACKRREMVKNSVWTNASVEAMMGGAGGDDQLIQSRPWNNPL